MSALQAANLNDFENTINDAWDNRADLKNADAVRGEIGMDDRVVEPVAIAPGSAIGIDHIWVRAAACGL